MKAHVVSAGLRKLSFNRLDGEQDYHSDLGLTHYARVSVNMTTHSLHIILLEESSGPDSNVHYNNKLKDKPGNSGEAIANVPLP